MSTLNSPPLPNCKRLVMDSPQQHAFHITVFNTFDNTCLNNINDDKLEKKSSLVCLNKLCSEKDEPRL